jgi:hypothetical protein
VGRTAAATAEPACRPRPDRGSKHLEVVARDRAHNAHQLHLSGLDWPEIAARTGYLDGPIAAMAVNAYLQKIAVEQAPEHRRQALDLELARLDALQAAYWPAAVAGDLAAAAFVLKVITRRCTVLGFDHPKEDLAGITGTLVVGGDTEQYIAGLKAIVGKA